MEASHQQEMFLLSTINNSFYTAMTFPRKRKEKQRNTTSSTLLQVKMSQSSQLQPTQHHGRHIMPQRHCLQEQKNKSPFLHYFDYGENKEGYWDYNHMVLQFEDVLDCLKVMHPNFHFVFLFDH